MSSGYALNVSATKGGFYIHVARYSNKWHSFCVIGATQA
jgi:hypothetical protein